MKRFFLKKYITSLLIMGVLFTFSICNLLANGPALREELRTIAQELSMSNQSGQTQNGVSNQPVQTQNGVSNQPGQTQNSVLDQAGQNGRTDQAGQDDRTEQNGQAGRNEQAGKTNQPGQQAGGVARKETAAWAALAKSLKGSLITLDALLDEAVSRCETAVNEHLLGRFAFIEGYGAVQQLLGKREENNFEIVKNDENILFDNTRFYNVMGSENDKVSRQIERLRNVSEKSGAVFLTTLITGKEPEQYSGAAAGYPTDYFHENTEYLRAYLEEHNIDYVDLRDPYPTPEGTYYRTDHHWSTQKGFDAFRKMAVFMDEHYAAGLDPTGFFTDPQNYNFIRFPKLYLGSQGRKTGLIYGGGPEDFTLIYPKFTTEFKLTIEDYSEGMPTFIQEGRMEDSLIDTGMFMNDWNVYEKDYYGSYMYGVAYPLGQIENRRNPDGPKVLCIRDSYSCVPMTFFASLCSRLDVMYPLKFQDSTKELIESESYDYVILMAYPANYGVGAEGGGFFDFKL